MANNKWFIYLSSISVIFTHLFLKEELVGLDPTGEERMREALRGWRSRKSDDFCIEQDPERGLCVIAKRRFVKGDFLMEYEGQFISGKERRRRERFYAKDDPGSYIVDAWWRREYNVAEKVAVDATRSLSTFGRLINHAPDPNVVYWPHLLHVDPGEPPRMALCCHKTIEPGEELFWHYGVPKTEAEWADQHRKTMTNIR